MYLLMGILFCILQGILVAKFGRIAILWTPIGFAFGLFASANISLPIIMGMPKAYTLVSKKEMRSKVYLALLIAPIIWLSAGLLFTVFFLAAFDWTITNKPLIIGGVFGFVVILFSPFSRKTRYDFKSDFDRSYGRYYTNLTNFSSKFTDKKDKLQLKQIKAVIKIFSNLYLDKTTNTIDVFKFEYPDSKFRFLVFCLTAAIKSCEDLLISSESVQKECLHFLVHFAVSMENEQEFFGQSTNLEDAQVRAETYFNEFMKTWTQYNDAKKDENEPVAESLLSAMVHSVETGKQLTDADKTRLDHVCWDIDFAGEPMRDAFIELTK